MNETSHQGDNYTIIVFHVRPHKSEIDTFYA